MRALDGRHRVGPFARFLSPEDNATTPQPLTAPSVETIFPAPRHDASAMKDVRIRQAIGESDRQAGVADQLFGGGEPPPSWLVHRRPAYNDELEPYPYDMDHATQLARRPPRMASPSTPPIHVVTRRASTCATTSFAEYVANQLNQIGLTADSEVIEIAQYNEQYDINYHDVPEDRGWIGTNPHGNEIMDVSSTAQAYYSCDGGSSTYCNPELDKALDAAIPLVGEERQKALAEVTRMFLRGLRRHPHHPHAAQLRLAAELHWTPRLDGFILLKEMSD